MQSVSSENLVFIDEAGCHTSMTPLRARGPKGERVVGRVPRCRGTVTTMIGALTLEGLQTIMTIEGRTDAEVFRVFVDHFLVPELLPGDVVVLDNLGAHRASGIREAIEAVGAEVVYLPPYHPDLNPIEEAWSKLKQILRRSEARNHTELDNAIAEAMDEISIEDTVGWLTHAGYQVN